jgi:hypothetical protein
MSHHADLTFKLTGAGPSPAPSPSPPPEDTQNNEGDQEYTPGSAGEEEDAEDEFGSGDEPLGDQDAEPQEEMEGDARPTTKRRKAVHEDVSSPLLLLS